jgi:hypothetical protein
MEGIGRLESGWTDGNFEEEKLSEYKNSKVTIKLLTF